MCDGKQSKLLLFAVSHYPMSKLDALNAAPMCIDVCDAVMVGNAVMRECRHV